MHIGKIKKVNDWQKKKQPLHLSAIGIKYLIYQDKNILN